MLIVILINTVEENVNKGRIVTKWELAVDWVQAMRVLFLNWRGQQLRQVVDGKAGLTLVEVVVSLALTLVLIGGLLNLLLLGVNSVSQGKGRTAACVYAVSLLEEMKSRPELLAGVALPGPVKADSMPFIQSHPPGVEAEIDFKLLEGAQQLYVVNLKVLTTGGSRQWEECLVGIVRVP